MLNLVNEDGTTPDGGSLIDDIVRQDARRMLAAVRENEVKAHVVKLVDRSDETGRRLVVRNARWRAVNAPHLVAGVRAGARFEGGQPERPEVVAA